MYKSFNMRTDVSSQENTLYENCIFYSQSFDDSYTRRYANSSWYHMSSSLTGYLGNYQTCFDTTPITSPTSNALLDLTYGMSTGSTWYSSTVVQQTEKANIYKIFASTLLGSTTKQFSWAGTTYNDLFFITLKRNVFKDYIRSNNVTLWLTASTVSPVATMTASDSCATSLMEEYAGNYGPLLSCSTGAVQGLIFYNAGVIAITTSSFYGPYFSGSADPSKLHMNALLTGSTLDSIVDGLRRHIQYVNVHPATRIHSTIYKCILLDKEFNLSSNPSYTDTNGLIRVMSGSLIPSTQQTRTYCTSLGLADDFGNLLAVASLSYPVLKTPSVSLIFSVRIDY